MRQRETRAGGFAARGSGVGHRGPTSERASRGAGGPDGHEKTASSVRPDRTFTRLAWRLPLADPEPRA
jgi:hypothetical protein